MTNFRTGEFALFKTNYVVCSEVALAGLAFTLQCVSGGKMFVCCCCFRHMGVGCRGKTRLTGSSRRVRGWVKAALRRLKVHLYWDWDLRMLATTYRLLLLLLLLELRQLQRLFKLTQKLQLILLYASPLSLALATLSYLSYISADLGPIVSTLA